MKKEIKKPTKFFKDLVEIYFSFFEKKFGFKPSFDGSAPRDLKLILDAMEKRSTEKGFEWTKQLADQMLNAFLEEAHKDLWLRDNFLLQNLNRQKDKLFFKIKSKNNGTSKEQFTRTGVMDEISRRYGKQPD